MDQYRKLNDNEISMIIRQYENADKITIARKIIKMCYGENAYKVFIKCNSDYNDEYYDIELVVIVLDESMEELDPISGINANHMLKRDLYKGGDEQEEDGENYTFFMDNHLATTPLYVKVGEEYGI